MSWHDDFSFHTFPCKIAAAVRIVTLPPMMAVLLLLLLYALRRDMFAAPAQLALSIVFLAIAPVIAYPVWLAIPPLRRRGRATQRPLAFVTTFCGYAGAVIYGVLSKVTPDLMFVYLGYAISYLALVLFNVAKVKASGHACGVVGPLILFLRATAGRGIWFILPCVVLFLLVTWSSLTLKRHTVPELLWGASTALMGFVGAMLVL